MKAQSLFRYLYCASNTLCNGYLCYNTSPTEPISDGDNCDKEEEADIGEVPRGHLAFQCGQSEICSRGVFFTLLLTSFQIDMILPMIHSMTCICTYCYIYCYSSLALMFLNIFDAHEWMFIGSGSEFRLGVHDWSNMQGWGSLFYEKELFSVLHF